MTFLVSVSSHLQSVPEMRVSAKKQLLVAETTRKNEEKLLKEKRNYLEPRLFQGTESRFHYLCLTNSCRYIDPD